MAAEMAKSQGIRVYTIALGKEGKSKQVVAQLSNGEKYEEDVENQMDTKTLQTIAAATGGIFYQAATNSRLEEIYDDIDKLERTKMKVSIFAITVSEFSGSLLVFLNINPTKIKLNINSICFNVK